MDLTHVCWPRRKPRTPRLTPGQRELSPRGLGWKSRSEGFWGWVPGSQSPPATLPSRRGLRGGGGGKHAPGGPPPASPPRLRGRPRVPRRKMTRAVAGSLCQLHDGFQSRGWWLPASPLGARLFQDLAASLLFQGGKDGGRAAEEGGARVPAPARCFSEANFSSPVSAAHCWWNGLVALA